MVKAKRYTEIVGLRFGRLTIIKEVQSIRDAATVKRRMVSVVCDCGATKDVLLRALTSGHTKSCGCLHSEIRKSSKINFKHGLSKHSLYSVWKSMKARCYNKNVRAYKNYGARGISICKEWLDDFYIFYLWSLSNGYSQELEIDRINNDGDYSPENCRWVTPLFNTNNRRVTVYVTFNGKKVTLKELCRSIGKESEYVKIYSRHIRSGWPLTKAIYT